MVAFKDKRDKLTINDYLHQDNKELEAFKVKLLLIIAQSDIRYINLCKLQYELDDVIFKLD